MADTPQKDWLLTGGTFRQDPSVHLHIVARSKDREALEKIAKEELFLFSYLIMQETKSFKQLYEELERRVRAGHEMKYRKDGMPDWVWEDATEDVLLGQEGGKVERWSCRQRLPQVLSDIQRQVDKEKEALQVAQDLFPDFAWTYEGSYPRGEKGNMTISIEEWSHPVYDRDCPPDIATLSFEGDDLLSGSAISWRDALKELKERYETGLQEVRAERALRDRVARGG